MSHRALVEAVVFDWGGTLTPWHLIDPLDPWRAYARGYDAPDVEALAARLHEAEHVRWTRQRVTAGAVGTGRLDDLFLSAEIELFGVRHARALDAYLRWWDPHTLADPDALPLLQQLHARGIRVGVLSNTMWSRTHHEEVLARDGLLEYIDGAVFTSELPIGKPHRDAFLAALAAVGVDDPAHAVFVGDRPYDDVHGAQAVGMRGILFPHDNLHPDELVAVDAEADAVVARLGEVWAVVDEWNSQ